MIKALMDKLPEPIFVRIGRFLCTHYGMHGVVCRGRQDHSSPEMRIDDPRLKRWGL